MTAMARDRKLTRRGFMEAALASGLTVTAASTLWSRDVKAATPKSGGTFRAGLHDSNTSDTLDPALVNSEFTTEMVWAIRNNLTELVPDGSVVGELAESWEASDDASQWVFKLRQGVEFHNGKTMTAADVVASINYHRTEDSKSGAKPLLADITEIKADGDKVVVTLASGNADLPFTLADSHMNVCPSDGEGAIDVSGVGTGPYVVESFDPGVKATMTKNANYWKAGRGHFDGVVLLGLSDPNARQTAITTGEVDAISDVELKTADLLDKLPEVIVDEVASGAHATIPMFANRAPFDNNDVRLALKYAIDREGALTRALRGHGTIGNDQPIGPTMPYYSELPQRVFDPEKVKYHLGKAGLTTLDVDLSAGDAAFNGAVDLAILYSEDAKKAGINIKVVREPNDGYWSNVWMAKPFCVSTWSARPTPDVMFTIAYKGGADWNESLWSHERFDMLLAEAKGELDNAKRTEIYHEMMMIVRDEGSAIIPFFRNRVMARRSNVMHEDAINGDKPLDGNRAAERWWFA